MDPPAPHPNPLPDAAASPGPSVCFVQKQAFAYFGVMALAGSLGEAGFACDALIANLERDLVGTLASLRPAVVAFSALTTEHAWLAETAAAVRRALPRVPIVVGGVHAVLYPEEVLAIPEVDVVCTGEGERTLVPVCRALSAGEPLDGMRGIARRSGGGVVVAEREALLPDLDAHREDRLVYYRRYALLREEEQKQFLASRGCPYRCAFCFNDRFHALFPGQWGRIRRKSPGRLVEEIEAVRAVAPLRSVFFADDFFASDKGWLREFGALYRARIGVPFMCVTRADGMDAETASLLREAGCHTVSVGVESGSEEIRRTLLGKNVRDDDIVRCAQLLHAAGIRVQTSNMFCLPGETLEDALRTVRLNVRIRADFVFTPLFLPFPGTRLAELCVARGYLPADFGFRHLPQSFLGRSVLDFPDRRRIENLQRVAYFLVKFPALLRVAEPALRGVRAGWVYAPFLLLGTFLRYRAERRLTTWGALRFLWRLRKSY